MNGCMNCELIVGSWVDCATAMGGLAPTNVPYEIETHYQILSVEVELLVYYD